MGAKTAGVYIMDFALAYKALPAADLPPTATKPVKHGCQDGWCLHHGLRLGIQGLACRGFAPYGDETCQAHRLACLLDGITPSFEATAGPPAFRICGLLL